MAQLLIAPALIPLIPLAAAGVTAAAGAYTSWRNRRAQVKQNEADREHEIEMKKMDRANTLEDWNRTNQYNHPQQQMERLRQSGLNPNLVYGKGADNTATLIKTPQGQASSKPAPRSENWVGPAVEAYQTAVLQSQQIKNMSTTNDNVAKQTAALEADIRLKDAQKLFTDANTYKTTRDAAKTDWEISRADELRDQILENYRVQNRISESTNEINVGRYNLEKVKTTNDVQKTMQDILESRQRIIESKNRVEMSATQKLINEQELEKIKTTIKLLDKEIGLKSKEILKKVAETDLIEGKIKLDKIDAILKQSQTNKTDRESAILLRNMLTNGVIR